MRANGEMEMVRVADVRRESSSIWSILFTPRDENRWRSIGPGQFLMVWIPGIDEVPMSLSILDEDPFLLGITVQNIGEATEALCSLQEGEWIGIRGPYGNGFSLPDRRDIDRIIGVSGGVGGASTILPMERARDAGFETVNLVWARDDGLMLFRERWQRYSTRVLFSTDDGSFGHKGFVTELLDLELSSLTEDQRRRTIIFTCGPEVMMAAVRTVLKRYGVSGQFSLERFMKCGLGLCDSCSMSGRRVCMDGPVFSLKELDELEEFGISHRDRSGSLIPLKECVR
ncbi:MAG: dihydroorotate dehydrogenase electron transfer subunit [Thermoplasmatota archaeon]